MGLLSATYTGTGPDGQLVRWRDGKRLGWLLSVVYPLMPLMGVALHAWTGQPIALALPLVTGYVLMPLLDALIGEDLNNPPEAVVPQLEADRYYRWLTWATVPLYFISLIGCAWWAGTQHLPWWALRGAGLCGRRQLRHGPDHRP